MSGKWERRYGKLAYNAQKLARDYYDLEVKHRALEAAHDNLAAELAKRDESGPIVVTDEMVNAAWAAYWGADAKLLHTDSLGRWRKSVQAALEARADS